MGQHGDGGGVMIQTVGWSAEAGEMTGEMDAVGEMTGEMDAVCPQSEAAMVVD